MKLFVYVQGLRGAEPQLWAERPRTGSGSTKKPLQEHELPESEQALPIQKLEILYPYKGAPDVNQP